MEKLFAVRGATSAENNTESIIESVTELYRQMLAENAVTESQLVSLEISITGDITALNPATALRMKNLAADVPLFCMQEPVYESSVPHIIRFLLYYYGDKNAQPKSVYLKNAAHLKSSMLKSIVKSETEQRQCRAAKKLWLVTREYYGIAEAGGLKSVVKALAECSRDADISVTVFLPKYAFLSLETKKIGTTEIPLNGKKHITDFFEAEQNGIRFVCIGNEFFSNKENIYTYTEEEAVLHGATKGSAYVDTDEMNISFQIAVLHYAEFLSAEQAPDVVHCHDGHTAFLPALAKNAEEPIAAFFSHTKFFITIHNAGDYYRQQLNGLDYAKKMTGLPKKVLRNGLIENGVEPFLVSQVYATLTTVSPWYAEELHCPALSPFSKNFSQAIVDKKISLVGITNGIDYHAYNPAETAVSFLPFSYNPLQGDFAGKYQCRNFFLQALKEKHVSNNDEPASNGIECFGTLSQSSEKLFYFAYHGRIVHQKGIDVLLETIAHTCQKYSNCRFLIMGQGSPDYETACKKITDTFFGKVVYFKGYNKKIARLVTAVADFILLPSLFEPCGLEDFIAQMYATIPIAHAIGGLQKIEDKKTGFLFSTQNDAEKSKERFSTEQMSRAMEKTIESLVTYLQNEAGVVLENETMRNIIIQANKNIKNRYNWKKIISEQYFPLYGF